MSVHASRWQRFGHWISKVTHHLPAALMVSALVGIGHHSFHMLDAIDGYAYFSIGNLTAKSTSLNINNHPKVAVVLIDPKSHEDFYKQRSPLSRCELKTDLAAIYALPDPPQLLVVDLDLSPALPADDPEGAKTKDCQAQLDALLMHHRSTRTVLMEPSRVLDTEGQAIIDTWREQLSCFVAFGDPTLKISYGLLNTLDCKASSLAATAFANYREKPEDIENCLTEREHSLLVSPGQYLSGLRAVTLNNLPPRQVDARRNARTHYEELYRLPVVFFGGSYDDSDSYLTPVGAMYGVEVHAAAFMSLLEPTSELKFVLDFALDIGLGLFFGRLITRSWQYYFSLRFSEKAKSRQAAPYAIIGLTLGLLMVVTALTFFSFFLLRTFNIWLSPIPIAAGMLIESFFNSAVGEAVEEGYHQRQVLIAGLNAAHEHGPGAFKERVAHEINQRPHHAHGLEERAARFFFLDFQRLLNSHQYLAFTLLFTRRVMFFVLLVLFIWVSLH
ncbi:MAG: hypothetical protein ACOH2R_20155 [Pseudomonas sp.]